MLWRCGCRGCRERHRILAAHLHLRDAKLVIGNEKGHISPTTSANLVIIGQQGRIIAYRCVRLRCDGLASQTTTSLGSLLLLILLQHALIYLIAFEDLSLTPLLQLVLHVLAQAQVKDLIERCRMRPILQLGCNHPSGATCSNILTVGIEQHSHWTALLLLLLRSLVRRGAQITAPIVYYCVDFTLGMAIRSSLDRLNRKVARTPRRKLQGSLLAPSRLAMALVLLGRDANTCVGTASFLLGEGGWRCLLCTTSCHTLLQLLGLDLMLADSLLHAEKVNDGCHFLR